MEGKEAVMFHENLKSMKIKTYNVLLDRLLKKQLF